MKKTKRTFKLGLKRALRRKMELKVPKSDLMLEKDPFLLLGYGMNSYFTIMCELTIMCALICAVAIPLMMVYSTGNTLVGLSVYSLGNLGGSDVFCT